MSISNNTTKPSVLLIYHFFYPDDVISARLFSQFAEELAKRDWQVTVLTSNRYCRYPEKKIFPEIESWNNVSIIRCPRPAWDQANNYLRLGNALWMMGGWLLKTLKMTPFDVIIIGSDPQFSALLFPFLRLFKRAKTMVHWCHDLFPEGIIADGATGLTAWLAQKTGSVMKWAYQHVDLMVDLGPCMRKRLAAYNLNARHATLVPWALAECDIIPQADSAIREELFDGAKLALLYSGNLGKAHDFSLFLQLARRLSNLEPKIVFCFAGRGNRCKDLMEAVRPDDFNIRFASFVEESQLEKRLASADIHLLSLRPEWEGIVVPSKFFGSLAVGRPVIYAGPPNSAIAEWIRQFDIGMVLTADTIDEVARKLINLTYNLDKLSIWQKNAYWAYNAYFSKKLATDQWDRLLRKSIYR